MSKEIMLTQEQIVARAKEIGKEIIAEYKDETIVLVGILKGAVMWMADVMKSLEEHEDVQIDFMMCSSYGAGRTTSGNVKVLKDIETDVTDKVVIIVEDIIDSGITLQFLKEYIKIKGAKVVKTCSLLDKPTGRLVDLQGDYIGFVLEDDKFIVGYGLDDNQKYRQLPYISYVK